MQRRWLLLAILIASCRSYPAHYDTSRELLPDCHLVPAEQVHSVCDCPASESRDRLCAGLTDGGNQLGHYEFDSDGYRHWAPPDGGKYPTTHLGDPIQP